jgi:hypothetical protein
MKKSLFAALMTALLLTGAVFTVTADENQNKAEPVYKYPFQESNMSYRNVTVYKVLDQKDAYIVMYAKGHREVGNIAIPKRWYKEKPRKLAFRSLSTGMSPYMTVFYRGGEFDQVVLTMPVSRADPVWGVADSNVQVDASKDTFDIVY